MTIGIIVFPGSNCDRDVRWATEGCLGIPTKFLWHETTDLSDLDAVILPGGFSYGDYLRCGAIGTQIHRQIRDLVALAQCVPGS